MAMNIGYFIRNNWFPPRAGSTIHAYQLASNLVRRGHTISTIFKDSCDPNVERYRPRQVLRFLKNIDIIYIRIFGALETGKFSLLKLLRRLSCPVVWEVNAPLEEALLTGRSQRQVANLHWQCRLLAKLVDGCICNTQTMADYSASRWGIRKNVVVPNGSDPELFNPGAREEQVYDNLRDRFKVVWAGTPQYRWHSVPLIFDVAQRMLAADPEIVFILIGKRNGFEHNGSVPSNVQLVDEQSYYDMPRYLASADLGLCLYERQNIGVDFYRSPLKLFDYMACGLPVVVTEEAETRRIIRQEKNGVLTRNDAEQLVDVIREVKQQPDRAKKLGQAARRDIEQYYNWSRVAEETERVLTDLL